MMILPKPGPAYSEANESETRAALEREDRSNQKKNQNIEMRNRKLILYSPDGSGFYLSVDNAGVLSAVAV